MTVPGVSVRTAATFIAAIGRIDPFPSPRKLVGYLGLDPTVRQSGAQRAHHVHISKHGPRQVRLMLTEAAHTAAATPGPLRAFHERTRARRGSQIATIALARKLAVLFWHLLTRNEDYAFQRPSLTQRKLRALELAAGAQPRRGTRDPDRRSYANQQQRALERERSQQAEAAYRRLVADWQATTRTPTPT
jgi:transposase